MPVLCSLRVAGSRSLLFVRSLLIALGLMAVSVPADAGEGVSAKVEAAIRAQLGPALQGAEITAVSATPVPGLLAVELDGAETAFVSADGNYLISGDLYQVIPGKGLVNQTDQQRGSKRRAVLAKLDRSQLISFPARGKEKSSLYIFTDVDCGYCRKLHQEVPKLNEAGITVHYLAFPRSGADSETGRKMDAVWCALDRGKAMTASKRGSAVPPSQALCKSPVGEQYRLGLAMGVRGTPAVYNAKGDELGGYIPAAELIRQLTTP
jgi:thiol:disulfide interchange protein DsbC